ncbi:MAG: ATP-dependent DNA helicase [Actinobacteria bacterium]|uniref:DNA 5'-3' helicase n=1 Tax=freshwater metagenome TaxID=449393 RepID=A0A6J6T873_9ZZZZ|nr:ATP-dependent DNA helicase [Actinomycetota bacterium]MSX24555.1 ATP-dependent DNA helicase [Actinomycetota bacterium]MSY46809.1 ATP-dependent DNA helicase [Actinomycetota bacterium]MSY56940.1 ATP-dependent DNA helicase [Actinomycetota bacterium]MTA99894.1 ATP-dependent DNA helicase [Actinomycetota bacterium]
MSDQSAKVRKALEAAIEAIGGTSREGQIEMAEAVANALSDRHHLMVQAGTGTGKSLAYLVPALVHGKKVLVATATLALQRQLVERDLPRIVPALEKALGREISYGIYKGVGNYICLQKMNSETPDPDGDVLLEVSSLGQDAKRLAAWAKTPGVSGDRDDAPDVDRRVWAANSLSGRECVGADVCAYGHQCFAAIAKSKAQTADVVVTNHTLLAIEIVDSHPILPERDAVILDEAHEFMDRTTQAVTEELTGPRVNRAAAMARKHMPGKLADVFTKAADAFDDAMDGYGQRVKHESTLQGRLQELPSELEAPIRKVRESAQAIMQMISADEEIVDSDSIAERARVKGAVNEVSATAAKLLKLGVGQVLWYEPTFSTLHLAPLAVSSVLRANLLTKTPVIATSATLTVGNGFDAMARNIGFVVGNDVDAEVEEGDLDPANVQMLDVGSPFDFANQGMLYMPKHLPEPGRDGPSIEALTELGELIDAAGGRTLALFSSWRGVEAADAHLRKVLAELPIKIITQKRGDAVGPLVERFIKDPTSILLGTMSLWQGVDVPGASCILVAIDRIPFPRPDDPVMSARAAEIDASGGSGFMEVSLPRAALLLAQGTGRLIRSEEDRGVVAILDSRIVTKRYGSVLLNSMPPLWRTSDAAIVKDSLKRLSEELMQE